MNTSDRDIAMTAFRASLADGDDFPPPPLKQALSALKEDSTRATDLNSLAGEIAAYIDNPGSVSLGVNVDEKCYRKREVAIRWIVRQIREWGQAGCSDNLEILRTLVTAAYTLDVKGLGLAQVASFVVTQEVKAGLNQLISKYVFEPFPADDRQRQVHESIKELAIAARYERILPRYHHLFFFPGGDICACVVLLHATAPDTLAKAIALKNDINFSALVNTILEGKALRYALNVPNVGFKFACVAPFLNANRHTIPNGIDAPLGPLLRQVAHSSNQDWNGWMQAFLKYPGAYPVLEEALASELPKLEERHWLAFLRAPSLSFSYRSADSFANLLVLFRQSAGDELLVKMCTLAYQIWDQWDYREQDVESFMLAPQASAFDFPVAIYYANLTGELLLAEEARLTKEIDSIEQRWFDSASALLDERYRLMSRLRLVLHGKDLKNGSQEALPPMIEQEASPYFRARYMYYSPSQQT